MLHPKNCGKSFFYRNFEVLALVFLFLSTLLPSRQSGGGEICSLRFIEALQELKVPHVVAGDARPGDDLPQQNGWYVLRQRTPEFSQLGARAYLSATAAYVLGWPISLYRNAEGGWPKLLSKIIEEVRPTAIIADHTQTAILLQRLAHSFAILAHNVETDIYRSLACKTSGFKRFILDRETRLFSPLEVCAVQAAHFSWTLTDADREALIALGARPSAVEVLPLFARLDVIKRTMKAIDEKRERLFDVGLAGSWTWAANKEGLEWLLKEVGPHLPTDFRIGIAGRGGEFLSGRDPRVTYVGFVPEISDFYARTASIAIPVFSGGGIQEKAIEAIGTGLPVVATNYGVRGVGRLPDWVRCADDPEHFASLLINTARSGAPVRISEALSWSRHRREAYLQTIEMGLDVLTGKASHHSR